MLTSLHIQNFKAWKDTGAVRLAPLTILFGANSAGKSSLGQLLLALKQTVLSADRKRPLHLGDENSLIDLGTFAECIHRHDLTQQLSFALGWQLPERLDVRDPATRKVYKGDELRIAVSLAADSQAQPHVQRLHYTLSHKAVPALDVDYSLDTQGNPQLASSPLKLVKTAGRTWPLGEPDKFYRISDQSRARYRNAEFLSDFALEAEAALGRLHFLGPLREYPKRMYSWPGDAPENVGHRGENAIAAILAAAAQKRMLQRGGKQKPLRFDAFLAQWLKELGVIESFSVKAVAKGRKEYEVLVKTHRDGGEVKLTDVGIGISQLLPALTQAFYCPPHSTVWMEQPEIHLHPQVQAELADVFIAAIKARENGEERNVQLVIESHSEYLLNRIQRRVAEGELSPDDVAVYFCRRTGSATELDPLRLNAYGEIENWPDNFFGDEMADISARTLAAMKLKKSQRKDAT
jgi:predicted ATPase